MVLFMLFALVPVFSSAATLFDDWVEDQQTIEVGGHTFFVQYIESRAKAILKMDNIGGMLDIGECESRENLEYCFEDVEFPSIKILIRSMEPDISISRAFSTASPRLGEEITVSVVLKNNGNKLATNIKYTDIFPKEFLVIASSGWEGKLSAGEEIAFSYRLKPLETVAFNSTAKISYYFDGQTKTKESSAQLITIKPPYELTSAISSESAEKNEVITFNLTIENPSEDVLEIKSLKITAPRLNIVGFSSKLKQAENELSYSGTLKKNEKLHLYTKVKSSRVGKYSVISKAELSSRGKAFAEETEKNFSIGLSDIVPYIKLSSDSVKSKSPYEVNISIKNFGKNQIKNVNVNIESDLFGNAKDKKTISPNQELSVMKKRSTSPNLEQEKTYAIKISGSYVSDSGRTFAFGAAKSLKVVPAEKLIEITRELSKESFKKGDQITITVKLKNIQTKQISDIIVSDIFPVEIRKSLQGDVTADIPSLGPGEEKQAYSYTLTIPANYTKSDIGFKTNVNAKLNNELYILEKEDKVMLGGQAMPAQEKPENITKKEESQNKTQKPSKTAGKEQTKKGIFTKIADFFKSLF